MIGSRKVLKMSEALERSESILDLFVIQDSQTVKTKGFYCKGGHHTSKDDCLFERVHRTVPGGSKIAEKASGERDAGAGWIANILQQKGRSHEDLSPAEHEHTVFAALDDEVLRAACQDLAGDLHKIGILAQRPGLPVIDDQDVDLLEHPPQGLSFAVDPEIHRVTCHQGRTGKLGEHVEL